MHTTAGAGGSCTAREAPQNPGMGPAAGVASSSDKSATAVGSKHYVLVGGRLKPTDAYRATSSAINLGIKSHTCGSWQQSHDKRLSSRSWTTVPCLAGRVAGQGHACVADHVQNFSKLQRQGARHKRWWQLQVGLSSTAGFEWFSCQQTAASLGNVTHDLLLVWTMWVFVCVQPCCNDRRMGSCIRILHQGSTTAKRWLAPSCLILVFAMVPASTQAAAPGYRRSAAVSKYSDSVGLFFCGARSPAHAQNGVVHCFQWSLPAA
jgi:hypothetical protein